MQIFTPKGTHLAISCTKMGKLKLSGAFAYENINNHGQFPNNSV